MSIISKIEELNRELPTSVTLVAVSKTHSAQEIMEAYSGGQRVFGESRPQEMCAKQEELPADIEWHMIGHLQRNKVRSIISFVSLIHSVDSARLLEAIDAEASRIERVVDVLLEVRVAQEESKAGWEENELRNYLSGGKWRVLKNVRFRGLMTIGSNTDDNEQICSEFTHVRDLKAELQTAFFDDSFDILSMGMTSDYALAVESGSTIVRVGSMIFGERDYKK